MTNPFKKEDIGQHPDIENEQSEEANKKLAVSNEETVEEVCELDQAEQPSNDESTKLKEEYDTLNNQYIRLAADFDNYRKRQDQEKENLLKFGTEETLKKLLDVLDNFDRGGKAIANVEDCEMVKESFNLVYKQLRDVLIKIGLEEIEATGQDFDPNLHEAVMQTPTNDQPEHTIIAELQKGYKLGDKVLRPTLVNVATAE